jgi:predicted Rossmann fold nucleotide-binding protein DprA/Smf involved in DNA uptake
LQAGGRAVAVLGCGIDIAYPKQHGRLMRECAQCGAVITEYFPGTKPYGYNFPMRNRIISALSDALLVVQAPRQSGALITARYALAQGKRLYTVPANVTSLCSEGSNRLLQAGAVPVLDSEDIFAAFSTRYGDGVCGDVLTEATQHSTIDADVLKAFGVKYAGSEMQSPPEKEGAPKKRAADKADKKQTAPAPSAEAAASDTEDGQLAALNERQRLLWSLLPETPFTVDCLVEQGISVSEAVGTLTMFEIYGLLVSKPGGVFERK